MTRLRNLLFVLLLAVIALPDGVTVCLRRLVAETVERGCCASGCNKKSPSREHPAVTSQVCAHCCVTTPASVRSVEQSTKKTLDCELAAPLVLACFTVAPPLAAFQLAPWVAHGGSPPPRSLSLPLRI